jgi:hypothetical protein
MQTDDEYRQTYNQLLDEQHRAAHERVVRNQGVDERRQEAQRVRNERRLTNAVTMNVAGIMKVAKRLLTLWHGQTIPGYNCAHAYAMLVYVSPRHAGFEGLIRAVVTIENLTRHHIHPRYANVPLVDREAAHAGLRTALLAYGDLVGADPLQHIPEGDSYHDVILARIQQERRVAEAAAAARAAAEAAGRHAAFAQADRERPVVFQRDPEGGIDLRAFATDTQSVHRSSVQNTTQRVIEKLLERPVPEDQATIFEITIDLNNPVYVRWRNDQTKLITIDMFQNDYFHLEAFSVKYKDVVDRVWNFVRGHTERTELVIRIAEELFEGSGMCANGKMARMVNVLQGYDETLDIEPPRELFQSAIAALMKRPLGEREARARELFHEYQIPAEEHDVWLEPLLDAADDDKKEDDEIIIIETLANIVQVA